MLELLKVSLLESVVSMDVGVPDVLVLPESVMDVVPLAVDDIELMLVLVDSELVLMGEETEVETLEISVVDSVVSIDVGVPDGVVLLGSGLVVVPLAGDDIEPTLVLVDSELVLMEEETELERLEISVVDSVVSIDVGVPDGVVLLGPELVVVLAAGEVEPVMLSVDSELAVV